MAREIARPSATYLKVMNGEIIQDLGTQKPDHPEAKVRPHKTKGQVYYLPIRNVTGYIQDIRYVTKELDLATGKVEIENLEITIQDEGDDSPDVLSVIWGSTPANSIMYKLPNVDPARHTKIWANEFKGKDYVTLAQSDNPQGDDHEIIKSAFPKGANSPIPELQQVTRRGKVVWDDTARLQFFMETLKKFRNKHFSDPVSPASTPKGAAESEDDLPPPGLDDILGNLD